MHRRHRCAAAVCLALCLAPLAELHARVVTRSPARMASPALAGAWTAVLPGTPASLLSAPNLQQALILPSAPELSLTASPALQPALIGPLPAIPAAQLSESFFPRQGSEASRGLSAGMGLEKAVWRHASSRGFLRASPDDSAEPAPAAPQPPRPPADPVVVEEAELRHLPEIMKLATDASIGQQDKDGGFAVTGLTLPLDQMPAYYSSMIQDPNVFFPLFRDAAGKLLGFSIYFTKAGIHAGDPKYELHTLAKYIVEGYGADEDLIFFSVAAAARDAGKGVGKRMLQHIILQAKSRGIDFIFGRIINDTYLKGTVLEDQTNLLDNAASRGAFTQVPGTVRITERFVHSAELAAFLKDGTLPPAGIHNWQLFGISYNPAKPLPVDITVPAKNSPPKKASSEDPARQP